jgi:hypothetical protein
MRSPSPCSMRSFFHKQTRQHLMLSVGVRAHAVVGAQQTTPLVFLSDERKAPLYPRAPLLESTSACLGHALRCCAEAKLSR